MTLDPWWLAGGVSPANCVAAYQPIGADSLQASYLNLANPGTYNAALGVEPTFDASTGWSFNGSTQYLTTGITPNTASGWSMIVRFSNVTLNKERWLCGNLGSSGGRFYLAARRAPAISSVVYGSGGSVEVSPSLSSGVLAIAGQTAYRNNVADGTIPTEAGTSYSIYIGARNNDGTNPAYFSDGNIISLSIYNTILTTAQVAAITTAMNALTGESLPTYQMPSAGMRRWAKLYSQQVGTAFIPAWARHSNRIITPGVMLP